MLSDFKCYYSTNIFKETLYFQNGTHINQCNRIEGLEMNQSAPRLFVLMMCRCFKF